MKLYFDENFPPSISQALKILEEPNLENEIFSTSEEFARGIPNPKLIREIVKNKGVWTTFDRKALKAHYKVLKRHKVPVFTIEYGRHSYSDKIYPALRHWEMIKFLLKENEHQKFSCLGSLDLRLRYWKPINLTGYT